MAELLGRVPDPVSYAVLVSAVLAESVLLIGAFVPTLTLLLTAGALGRSGVLELPLVVTAAACAVVAGDALGHRTGRLLGARARTGRIGRRVPAAAWLRAGALMDAYGGQAVFLARFVPVVRTLAPHLAGAALLPYRRIAPYSAVAALVWAGAEAGAGYAAASALPRFGPLGGPAIGVALAAAAALAVTGVRLRRRREGRGGRGGRDRRDGTDVTPTGRPDGPVRMPPR
nr:VTT domain-containing protein [Streptomyces sp. HNM0575]